MDTVKKTRLSTAIKSVFYLFALFPLSICASEIEELRIEIDELKENYSTLLKQQAPIIKAETSNGLYAEDTTLNIYGFIRADASFQDKGSIQMYNDINKIPLSHESNKNNEIKSSVNFTRIGVDAKTDLNNKNVLNAKLEVDFIGGQSRDQFRIRHAYLQYNNWTIGHTTSTFVAPEYMASTVDYFAYTGGAIIRTPLVAYSHRFYPELLLQVSVEDPKYTATSDPDIEFKLPVFATKLKYSPNSKTSGSIRSFIAQKEALDHNFTSWGLGFGGQYHITPKLSAKGNYYHVKGDGRYILWSNPAYIIENNKMTVNEFDSINVGLNYVFSDKVNATLAYGLMKYQNQNNESIKFRNQNKQHWQGWGNIFYKPNGPFLFGLEYVYGERENFSNQKGQDSRLNLMASYNF